MEKEEVINQRIHFLYHIIPAPGLLKNDLSLSLYHTPVTYIILHNSYTLISKILLVL